MRAEELFKKLGYEKTYDKEGVIVYSRTTSGYMASKITFSNGLVWYETLQTTQGYFKPNEIKAINKQLEELGLC